MQFITQPFAQIRLGEFLLNHFADPQWTVFRAAIAFVKRSGTQRIRQRLQEFDHRAQVKISVGIDFYGTSREGLSDLLQSTPNGEVFVYRNNGPYTFHPKVYLFKSNERADVVVGSGNLTGGGLFTNYEASLAASLDRNLPADSEFLHIIEVTLDAWSHSQAGTCYLLTPEFLEQLVQSGLVRSEAQLAAMQQQAQAAASQAAPAAAAPAAPAAPAPAAPLFVSTPVPPAPAMPVQAAPEAAEILAEVAELPSAAVVPPPGVVLLPSGGVSSFVMTLQNTDVGRGQVRPGRQARSPEVFIPLAALDQNSAFWTFPTKFTPDVRWNRAHPRTRRNGLGKLDRLNVPIRIGVVRRVSMFFNPNKKDFRLRNEVLRSSGHVGDILLVRRVDPVNGFEYEIEVAPKGSPLFQQLQPLCHTAVPHSQKLFGYF